MKQIQSEVGVRIAEQDSDWLGWVVTQRQKVPSSTRKTCLEALFVIAAKDRKYSILPSANGGSGFPDLDRMVGLLKAKVDDKGGWELIRNGKDLSLPRGVRETLMQEAIKRSCERVRECRGMEVKITELKKMAYIAGIWGNAFPGATNDALGVFVEMRDTPSRPNSGPKDMLSEGGGTFRQRAKAQLLGLVPRTIRDTIKIFKEPVRTIRGV